MSFVSSAWTLTIFLLLISLIAFYLSYKSVKKKKRFIEAKEVLFLVALAYLLLAHFSMYASLGQSLEDSNAAPCEMLINQTNTTGNLTSYTYYDSCADNPILKSSSALVVIFTWLIFILYFVVLLAVITYLTRFVRDFF